MVALAAEMTAEIPGDAGKVYDLLADYREGHPKILPPEFFRDLTVTAGGRGAGTAFTATAVMFGKAHPFSMTVAEPAPGHVLTETDAATGMRTTFTVTARGAGVSAVTIATRWESQKGIAGLIESWLMPRTLRKVYREELRLLAALFNASS